MTTAAAEELRDRTEGNAVRLGAGAPAAVFDVGGTFIKYAILDSEGILGQIGRVPTPAPGPGSELRLADCIAELSGLLRLAHPEVDFSRVGVAVPGIVDERTGQGIYSENLGWRDVNIRDVIADRSGLHVTLAHDVRAGGAAEVGLGAARGARDAVVVIIGTGIAAAIYVDGRPLVSKGYAGEIGHVPVRGCDDLCACGRAGCLEAVASAAAIVRRYADRSGVVVAGAEDVIARAGVGDSAAAAVWSEAILALAHSLAGVAASLAPEVIVLGGGLSRAGDALLGPLRREVEQLLPEGHMPPLALAEFGSEAGLVGVALAVRASHDPGRR